MDVVGDLFIVGPVAGQALKHLIHMALFCLYFRMWLNFQSCKIEGSKRNWRAKVNIGFSFFMKKSLQEIIFL